MGDSAGSAGLSEAEQRLEETGMFEQRSTW